MAVSTNAFRADYARRKFEVLKLQVQPYREAVEQLKTVQRKHIAPVDHLMEELYARYGKLAGTPVDMHAIEHHHFAFTLSNQLAFHAALVRAPENLSS